MGPFGSDSSNHTSRGYVCAATPRLDEALDLAGIRVTAGLEHDRGADVLTELVVGQAHHRGLHDVGVLMEHLLDLARVDVELPRMIISFLRSTMTKK